MRNSGRGRSAPRPLSFSAKHIVSGVMPIVVLAAEMVVRGWRRRRERAAEVGGDDVEVIEVYATVVVEVALVPARAAGQAEVGGQQVEVGQGHAAVRVRVAGARVADLEDGLCRVEDDVADGVGRG